MSSKRNYESTASKTYVGFRDHGYAPNDQGDTVYKFTIFKHADGRSPHFYCQYRHPKTARQVQFSCKTSNEFTAQQYATRRIKEIQQEANSPSSRRVPSTLSAFCATYITERRTKQGVELKPASQKAIIDSFNQLINYIGDKDIREVTREDCRSFVEDRIQSQRSAQKHYCNLSSAFDEAKRQGATGDNYFHDIRKPVPKYTDEEIDARCFDEDDFTNLLSDLPLNTHAERRLRNMLLLAHETGVRNGELRHIRLDRIEISQKTLNIKSDRMFSMKTARSTRAIPLSETAIAVIQAQIEDNNKHQSTAVRESPYLFPNERGEPLSHAGIWLPFNKARKHTLPDKRPKIHGLRHALVTRLTAEGVQDRMIQSITGQSLEMIARYSHMNRRHIEPAREAMNKGKKYDIR